MNVVTDYRRGAIVAAIAATLGSAGGGRDRRDPVRRAARRRRRSHAAPCAAAGQPCDRVGRARFADWDERGEGFPRMIGNGADIGAFEASFQNQAPTATDDGYTTNENDALTVDVPRLLANESDPDGDALSVVLVDNVANDSLMLNADGSMVYIPAANFFATDSFTYEVTDREAISNFAAVTVEVQHVVDTDVIFASGFDRRAPGRRPRSICRNVTRPREGCNG